MQRKSCKVQEYEFWKKRTVHLNAVFKYSSARCGNTYLRAQWKKAIKTIWWAVNRAIQKALTQVVDNIKSWRKVSSKKAKDNFIVNCFFHKLWVLSIAYGLYQPLEQSAFNQIWRQNYFYHLKSYRCLNYYESQHPSRSLALWVIVLFLSSFEYN